MRLELPEGARGRWLALGLTLVVAAAMWTGVAQPLLDAHAEARERMERRVLLAARLDRVAAELPALEAAREAREAAGNAPSQLIEAASDALAAAQLQSLVQDLAAQAGIRLQSLDILPAETVQGHRRVSLRLLFEAPWPQLVRLLDGLAGARPPLLFDELSLRGSTLPEAGDGRAPPMSASLVVIGFRAGGEAQRPRGTRP